jgi:sulfur carrier protein ThiS
MKIRVRLIGAFMHRFGFSEKELEVPEDCTAGQLVTQLGLARLPKFVSMDGKAAKLKQKLKDGDRIVVAPIFSGG